MLIDEFVNEISAILFLPARLQTGFPFTTSHLPFTPQNTKSHGLPYNDKRVLVQLLQ